MHNTPIFCSSSAPSRDALPTKLFNAAMLNLTFSVFVLLHKILIPAENWDAQHTCFFLPIFIEAKNLLHKALSTTLVDQLPECTLPVVYCC